MPQSLASRETEHLLKPHSDRWDCAFGGGGIAFARSRLAPVRSVTTASLLSRLAIEIRGSSRPARRAAARPRTFW
jgi:hypothetical protein